MALMQEPSRADAGVWLHQIVQGLAAEATTPAGVLAASRAFFVASKLPNARWRGIRNACALGASRYLNQMRPPAGWELVTTEFALHRSRADLVYRHHSSGRVLIDEITLTCEDDDPDLVDQVVRLTAGGVAEWGDDFVGSRALLIEAPRRSWFQHPDGSRTPLSGPGWWYE